MKIATFFTCLVLNLHNGEFIFEEGRCWRLWFVEISFQHFLLISEVSDLLSVFFFLLLLEHPSFLNPKLNGFLVLKNEYEYPNNLISILPDKDRIS